MRCPVEAEVHKGSIVKIYGKSTAMQDRYGGLLWRALSRPSSGGERSDVRLMSALHHGDSRTARRGFNLLRRIVLGGARWESAART